MDPIPTIRNRRADQADRQVNLVESRAVILEPISRLTPLLPGGVPGGALPYYSGKSLQGNERLAQVGPVLQLVDGNMIAGLPARAAAEESARYVDHVRRTGSFINKRRSAAGAKAPGRPGGFIAKARDVCVALGHPKAPTPTADVSRIGRTMRMPGRTGMIVPSPPGGNVDLDVHRAAETLACRRFGRRCCCLRCNRRFAHARPHHKGPCRS
jgi:hypothetical protein